MPRIKQPAEVQTGEPSPEYLLHVKIVNGMRQFWVDGMRESGVSQVLYSRLSVVALSQLTAIVAVDVGMNEQQFLAVCKANFDEAHTKAPRFG